MEDEIDNTNRSYRFLTILMKNNNIFKSMELGTLLYKATLLKFKNFVIYLNSKELKKHFTKVSEKNRL